MSSLIEELEKNRYLDSPRGLDEWRQYRLMREAQEEINRRRIEQFKLPIPPADWSKMPRAAPPKPKTPAGQKLLKERLLAKKEEMITARFQRLTGISLPVTTAPRTPLQLALMEKARLKRRGVKKVKTHEIVASMQEAAQKDAVELKRRAVNKQIVNREEERDFDPPCPTCGLVGCPYWGLP